MPEDYYSYDECTVSEKTLHILSFRTCPVLDTGRNPEGKYWFPAGVYPVVERGRNDFLRKRTSDSPHEGEQNIVERRIGSWKTFMTAG